MDDFQEKGDPIDKLYSTLKKRGYYTKSIGEFKQKYSSPESIDKLYEVVNRDGLYTKTKDDFYKQYYPTATTVTPKKKEDTQQAISGLLKVFPSTVKTLLTGAAKSESAIPSTLTGEDSFRPEQREIDPNDPVKSYLQPDRDYIKEFRERRRTVESVGQSNAERMSLTNIVNTAKQKEADVIQNTFQSGNDAKAYLLNATGYDPDKLDTEAVDKIVKPDNETQTLAKNKYLKVRSLKEDAKNSNTFEQLALKQAARKGGVTKNQVDYLGESLPTNMKGELILQLLSDNDLYDAAKDNPKLQAEIDEQAYSLPERYPTTAIKYMAQMVSKKREEMGENNGILNIPSEATTTEIMNQLVKDGDLTDNFLALYNKKGVPQLVTSNLKTPGFVENVLQGAEQGIMGMGKTAAELTGIRSLYKDKADQTFQALGEQYQQVGFKPKGVLHEISTSGGNIVGQVLPMVAGGSALRASNLLKSDAATNILMTGLQTYGYNLENARTQLPDASTNEQVGLALTNTGIEMALANTFNDMKFARGLMKSASQDVKKLVDAFTKKEISAAAAKTRLGEIFDGVVEFGKKTGKVAVSEANEESATQYLQNTANKVFGGEQISDRQNFNEAFDVWKTTFLGSLVLGGVGGAANKMNEMPTSAIVYEMASNPEKYKTIINDYASVDEDVDATKDERIKNLDYASSVLSELNKRKLPEDKKANYLVKSLNEKILKEEAAKIGDPLLKKDSEKKLAELEISKKALLDPEMNNTKIVQEFFDNELLGKSSLENLSIRDEEGKPTNKFDPSKVGEYLKEAAQRLNNLDSDWQPNKLGDSSKAAKEAYPDAIAEIANERWKKEIEAAQPEIDFNIEKGEPEQISQPIELSVGTKQGLPEGSVGVGGDVVKNEFTGGAEFYHGTNKQFDKFEKQSKAGQENEVTEQPIFLAEDKGMADANAKGVGARTLSVKVKGGKFFDFRKDLYTDKPKFGSYDGLYNSLSEQGKDIYDAIENGEINLAGTRFSDMDAYDVFAKKLTSGDYDFIEIKPFKEWLIKKGYDGVFLKEHPSEKSVNLAVWNTDKLEINKPTKEKLLSDKSLPEKLKDHLKSITKEEFQKEWKEIEDMGFDGVDAKKYAEYLKQSLKEQPKAETPTPTQEAVGELPPIDTPPTSKGPYVERPGTELKDLDILANNVPDSGKVDEYMSKGTIEKYTGEAPTNDQQRGVQELEIALNHGEKIIEKAKEVFGDDYVEKTLEYIDNSASGISNKALMYVSLENALGREKQFATDERKVDLTKQQAFVYEQSQKFARENSLALNYQKLRKIAKVGYDIDKITNNFFSAEEIEGKNKLKKAIEADADTINKAAEQLEVGGMTPEIEKAISEGVEKEINRIHDLLPKSIKDRANQLDKALEAVQKKLRSKTYEATLGIPAFAIDASITVIRRAIKLGASVAEAVEAGIKEIKKHIGDKKWEKEDEYRKDALDEFAKYSEKEKKSEKELVRNVLIEKGFGREFTVKGETKKILDWKKLAGAAGTISKIRENVNEALKEKGLRGLSDAQKGMIKEEFIKEYVDLRSWVIERTQAELAKRNKENITPEQKSAAKKLAELYTYGLFDSQYDTFETTLNKALGAKVSEKGFNEAKEIAKGLETLYSTSFKGVKLSDVSAKAAIEKLEDRLRVLLFREAKSQGNFALRAANLVRNYFEIQQTMILNNLKQAVENPFSGLQQNVIDKITESSNTTSEMATQRRKMMKDIYSDIVLKGGIGYGKVESQFVNRQHIDDYVNKLSDSQLYHGVMSVVTGKATLNAMDAMFKAGITEKKFTGNLIKILTHDTNPKKMSKKDAVAFVSEKLTGQNFIDAQATAKEVMEKINKDAGSNLIPINESTINRLANDIVKASLEMGGKITKDQINAAYGAAYKAAGLGLGHEANNPLSSTLKGYSAKLEGYINQAIKSKEWNRAAALTLKSVLFRNILNPFVGGGTNWLVLKLEKTGLGLFTGLAYKWGSKSDIDLSTESGMNKLEARLYNQSRAKDNFMRGLIGGGISLLSYGAFLSVASSDEYRKWRAKNPWAARYLDILTPEQILAHMAIKNKQVKRYASSSFNRGDAFNSTDKLIKSVEYATKGQSGKAWGALGEAVGQKLNAPLPWRLIKDGVVLYQGAAGTDPYHGNYKPSNGFMSGVLQGGVLEFAGVPRSVDSSTKSNKPARPKLPKKPEK